jgi:hypothetical protein
MLRVRVVGTGWSGAPALSTFYFLASAYDGAAASDAVARVHAHFLTSAAVFPPAAAFQVDSNVDVLDPLNGNVTATLGATGQLAVQGAATNAAYLPPANCLLLQLETQTYLAGRRVRGRSYIGPVSVLQATATGGVAFGDGIAASSGIAFFNGTPIANLAVWRRPRPAGSGVKGNLPQRDGSAAVVTSLGVSPKFAVLKSRRD